MNVYLIHLFDKSASLLYTVTFEMRDMQIFIEFQFTDIPKIDSSA